jgi:hypothetical protein
MTKLLERLAKDLEVAGYQAQYQVSDKNQPLPHVLVKLASRQLALALASDAQKSQGEQVDSDVDYLQFFLPLSVAVKQQHVSETGALLAHLNATMPLVGFCLAQERTIVAFRHLMIIERDKVAGAIVAEAVDTIDFLVATYRDNIRDVASGQ